MDVSRPTLTRIYAKARAKIADALVTGKQIIIEGGKIYFDSEWYKGNGCNCLFNQPEKSTTPEKCPLCGGGNIVNYVPVDESTPVTQRAPSDICVCPGCGYEKEHEPSQRCKDEVCPVCSSRLMRKNNLLKKDI
jgi:rubrerythrin